MPTSSEHRFDAKLPTIEFFLFFTLTSLGNLVSGLFFHPESWLWDALFAFAIILILTAIWFFGIVPQFGNFTYIIRDTEIIMERAGRTVRIIPKAEIEAIKDVPYALSIKMRSGPDVNFLPGKRKAEFIQALYTPPEHTAHLPPLAGS